MKWILLLSLGISGLAAAAIAQTASPEPAYQLLRQEEDWSVLKTVPPAERTETFDPVKYVSLSWDGSIWASFGGQVRLRGETWTGFNFGAPASAQHDDTFGYYRVFAHADLHLGDHVRLFLQGKSADISHRRLPGGVRTTDADVLDIQNGFLELAAGSPEARFTLRSGRQELLFGRQRLVGPSDWTNTRRTFDGFAGSVALPTWKLTAFWARPAVVREYQFNRDDNTVQFFGLYATAREIAPGTNLDAYWLSLDSAHSSFDGESGHERRQTLGGRVSGKVVATAFDFEAEGAYQFGTLGPADIRAALAGAELGYTFAGRGTPRLHLGLEYGSGDGRPGDNTVRTLNPLYPSGHTFFGAADAIGRQNLVDLVGGVSLKPARKLTALVDVHRFWRAEQRDALYNKQGAVLRNGGPGTSRSVGVELDAVAKYQFDRHLLVEAGYAHLFAGRFLEQTGRHEDIDFGYASVQLTF